MSDYNPKLTFADDGSIKSIVMPRPSDFHNHYRRDNLRQAITPVVSRPYRYVLAMPNTGPHIYTLADAKAYKSEIMAILAGNGISQTELVMTIYLAEMTTPEMIAELAESGIPIAVKAYPPGGTTNSGEAVPILQKREVLKAMEELGVRLLIHGESTHDKDGNSIHFNDREEYFYNEVYPGVRDFVPDAFISLEHVTTQVAIETVREDTSGKTVCTITPQHCTLSNNDFKEPWAGTHARCMPYLKSPENVLAVRKFMVSGDRRAILGTDSAPHLAETKNKPFEEAPCGCYTPHALAIYSEVFMNENAMDDRFVQFACFNGPDWWGLPRPEEGDTITLLNTDHNTIPEPTPVPEENDVVIPLGWTEKPEDRMKLNVMVERE